MLLTFAQAAAATKAQVLRADRAPAQVRINTDTRTLQTGDTYLALRGERFDGHDYVDVAVSGGASALVVERDAPSALDVAALIVADTKRAYMELASAARQEYTGLVLAITGSTGKTTTKVLLSQLLGGVLTGSVSASPANENNEIGVSKLLLAIQRQAEAVIVEMGARHYGDIATLVEIARPQIGVLTNVGDAHLEIMGSRERLSDTKWGLFSGGARAVLNARDAVSTQRAAQLPGGVMWFGVGELALPRAHADDRAVFVVDRSTLVVRSQDTEATFGIDARLPGEHNLENLAAALAASVAAGANPAGLAPLIATLELPQGRYESISIAGRPRIVYDAYNASMSGTMATLDAFASELGSRRIAVLGSMAELGPTSAHMHALVGAHAARLPLHTILVSGDFAEDLARGAQDAGFDSTRIVHVASNAQAADWIATHAQPDDVVLLKGSRKYKLEEIVETLRA